MAKILVFSVIFVLTFIVDNYAQITNPTSQKRIMNVTDPKGLNFCSLFPFIPKIKSYNESCTVGKINECAETLSCISSRCSCQRNEYLNNTKCLPKLLLYFTSTNYQKITVNKINGDSVSQLNDIKCIEYPTYSIYIQNANKIAQFTENGSYVRQITMNETYETNGDTVNGFYNSLGTNNNSVFTTNWYTGTIFQFDSSLNVQYCKGVRGVYTPLNIRYNPSDNYLYVCDAINYADGVISVYTLDYKPITHYLLSRMGTNVAFYQSSYVGNLLLVATYPNNCIHIFKQSDRTTYLRIFNVCGHYWPTDIVIDQKSGYILISCLLDIKLWFTNGTHFINTGKTLKTDRFPRGMYYDSNGRLLIAELFQFSILM